MAGQGAQERAARGMRLAGGMDALLSTVLCGLRGPISFQVVQRDALAVPVAGLAEDRGRG